jgi:hypothetical protein
MAPPQDLSGTGQPGRGLGAGFMADHAVMELLCESAGFGIVPSTLNVRLPRPLDRGSSWRDVAATEISPDWEARSGQAGSFLAPVVIAERCAAGRHELISLRVVAEYGGAPHPILLATNPDEVRDAEGRA